MATTQVDVEARDRAGLDLDEAVCARSPAGGRGSRGRLSGDTYDQDLPSW